MYYLPLRLLRLQHLQDLQHCLRLLGLLRHHQLLRAQLLQDQHLLLNFPGARYLRCLEYFPIFNQLYNLLQISTFFFIQIIRSLYSILTFFSFATYFINIYLENNILSFIFCFTLIKYSTALSGLLKAARKALMTSSLGKPMFDISVTVWLNCSPWTMPPIPADAPPPWEGWAWIFLGCWAAGKELFWAGCCLLY